MASLKKTITKFLASKFLTVAKITAITTPSENFRCIELQSESFKKTNWNPGNKIQINVGDFNLRTYTPLFLDAKQGIIQCLIFIHGNGPGSQWASEVKVGDDCQVFGPRSSLDFSSSPLPTIFFGDETSFGVACTLRSGISHAIPAHFIFEVAQPEECRAILERNGIPNAKLIKKSNDKLHLITISETMGEIFSLSNAAQFVFTGNALSISKIRTQLKSQSIPIKGMKVKPYWAAGKIGLD